MPHTAIAMEESTVLVKFNGYVKYNTIEHLLKQAETAMDNLEIESRLKKKVYKIMVECLENVYKHAENIDVHKGETEYLSEFRFESSSDYFELTTINPISNQNMQIVKDRIEYINHLDAEGLKQMYKDVINSGSISSKGGAGLGLIDIAIKSQSKIRFAFKPARGNVSLFMLNVLISKQICNQRF